MEPADYISEEAFSLAPFAPPPDPGGVNEPGGIYRFELSDGTAVDLTLTDEPRQCVVITEDGLVRG